MTWRSVFSLRALAFLQVPLIATVGVVTYQLWAYSTHLKHEVQQEIEEVQARDLQIQKNVQVIQTQAHTIKAQYQKLHTVANDLLEISVQATHACSVITDAAAHLPVKNNPDVSALESCVEIARRLDHAKAELDLLPKS